MLMPYKRKGSPYFQIEVMLQGYGSSSQISTKVKDKSVARRMESMLKDIAIRALTDPAMHTLLEAICKSKEVSLPIALKAYSNGALHKLSSNLTNPLVSKAIEEFKVASNFDKPTWVGLDKLLQKAGNKRLSDLDAKWITESCFVLEREGLKRNTVCRQFKRGVSKLLSHHLGINERNRIFSNVNFSEVDDTRKINLTSAELKVLIDACEELGFHELTVIVRTALQTSADRGVLLQGKVSNAKGAKIHRGLLCRDVQIEQNEGGTYEGVLNLVDGKSAYRDRTVPITDYLCRELQVLMLNKNPDEPVFNTPYLQLDFGWNKVRKAAGFWTKEEGYTLRFKDLRAQTSQYGAMVGIPQQVLASTYGHSGDKMIRRYQKYNASMKMEEAIALESKMFGKTGS